MKKRQQQEFRSSRAKNKKAKRRRRRWSATVERRIEVVDLSEIPIQDPLREKSLVEISTGRLLSYLSRDKGCGIAAQNLRARIIEIYRRCYEDYPAEQDSHLRDFVAHFPQLIFEAEWIRRLVERYADIRELRPVEPRNRFFRALANGFRAVATPRSRFVRSLRDGGEDAARFIRREISKELKQWERTLDRRFADQADPMWDAELTRLATAKAAQLVQRYSQLAPYQPRITDLLRRKQHYEASVLIASKVIHPVFRVSQRALERK